MLVTERKTLYTLDEMNGGDVPVRAISYVDDCGVTHCFHVAISGEDNVPILIACTLPE